MERLKKIKACTWETIDHHAGEVADAVVSAQQAGQTRVEYFGYLHDVVKSVLVANGFCVHTENCGRSWHITWCLPAVNDCDDDDLFDSDEEDEDDDEEEEAEDVPCCKGKKKCCPCPKKEESPIDIGQIIAQLLASHK